MHTVHAFAPKWFFFLDINNLQAVAVLQDQNGVLNLYTSDSTGVNYTLSLEDLVHNAFYIDFNVVSHYSCTLLTGSIQEQEAKCISTTIAKW